MIRPVFIACSSEGLSYAKAFKLLLDRKLKGDNLELLRCEIWNEVEKGRAGNSNLENLLKIANGIHKKKGYAIAMCTPDDRVTIRGETYSIARDNVIFELGLFMGILGKDRVFALFPEGVLPGGNLKFGILTDLKGIQQFPYRYRGKNPKLSTIEKTLYEPVDKVLSEIKCQEELSGVGGLLAPTGKPDSSSDPIGGVGDATFKTIRRSV